MAGCALCVIPLLCAGVEQAVDDTFPMVQRTMQSPSVDNTPPADSSPSMDNLWSIIGRALSAPDGALMKQVKRGKAKGSDKAEKANVTMKMRHAEPGTTADIVQPMLPAACAKTAKDVKLCQVDLKSQGNPNLVFSTAEPFREEARFFTKTTVLYGNEDIKLPVTSFDVDCKMCGAPCEFELMGKPQVLETVRCPIAGFWTTPIQLHSWDALKGISIEMITRHMRSEDKEAMAFDLLTVY
eukprot:CAMPEP_0171064648 /NCGR_PEP_ID=MMETSP0766_2-20121228/6419_1 /TAXON_ID=439317 /ORGANISM="Gambierdiscus australes, Strain CAWD 149" /LENGTH=239 /DNA_ID=CAMNT_0011520705 /DNA_START=69 /DNA_END=788 /DNA_ORIENTATION=+